MSFPILAAAAPTSMPTGMIMQILPLILIFGVFWFLLIRPQQKRMKEHQALIAGLRRGDVVVTGGGFIGKVVKVADQELTVELAENVRVRVQRGSITEVKSKTEPANDSEGDEA
jgi:preprotein translocase subunit YajC